MVRLSHVAIFIATTSASILQRAQCNRDDCLRAVVASSAAPGPAQGSADCASFLRATATPCPVTSTATSSTTSTISVTASTTTTTTTTTISTVSATSTTTMTITVTSTATTTTTTSTTSVATLDPTGAVNKRQIEVFAQNKRNPIAVIPQPRLISNVVVERRAAVTTCPSVRSPSAVPTYASACSGTARYSSACSCDGVAASTTTLAPVTSSVTVTVTGPPVTTTVSTSTATSTVTATTSTTVTSATVTSTLTVTTSTTTTVGALATSTVGFTQEYQNTATSNCFYDYVNNGYLAANPDDTNSANNYQSGKQQCAQQCLDFGPACKAFYYSYTLDEDVDVQQTYGYCYLLDHQYTSSDIVCGQYNAQSYYIAEDNRDF